MNGRQLERPRNADQKHDHEDQITREPAVERAERQRNRGQRLGDLSDGDHHAPVAPIRHLPDENREQHQRHELHEPHDAEVERIVGELV